jgi:hypothetical protein
MSARRFLALALAAALFAALGASQGLAKGKKAASVVVGKDAKGDWGEGVDPTLGPLGDPLGQDLVGAAIGMKGKSTVNFIIQLSSLPPWGGWPEISRYTWDFNLDGKFRELDGKFLNYTRGVCDPTSGQCPPPRDPGMQPFFLRGNCTTTQNVTTCEELGVVQAAFDSGKGTITIPVPLKLLGAKPGSKIQPGANIFGGSISAAPSAFLTSGAFPMDTMTVTKTFQVPK